MEMSDEGKENEEMKEIVENYEIKENYKNRILKELGSIRDTLAGILNVVCEREFAEKNMEIEEIPEKYGIRPTLNKESVVKKIGDLGSEIEKIREDIGEFERKYGTTIPLSIKDGFEGYEALAKNLEEFYREFKDTNREINNLELAVMATIINYLQGCKKITSKGNSGRLGYYPQECREKVYRLSISVESDLNNADPPLTYLLQGLQSVLKICDNCPYIQKLNHEELNRQEKDEGENIIYDILKGLGLPL